MKILAKRRRLEGRTNYTKRKKLLEGYKPRIVARKTNRYIILQYIESKEARDFIKASAFSKELLEFGWPQESAGSLKSLCAAYLTGFLLGKRIVSKKLSGEVVLDTGLIRSVSSSRIYAAVKGIIDSGAKLKCNEKMFPKQERIKNKSFFDKVKSNIDKK